MAKDVRLQAVQQVTKKLDDDPDFAAAALALCANPRLATGEFVDLHDSIETNGDTFAAVADDGALCLIDTANGRYTVDGKEVVRGRMGFVPLAPHLPAISLYEGEKRRLIVAFGRDRIARSRLFDEIYANVSAPYCFGVDGEDRVLLTFSSEFGEIIERCRARRIVKVFEDGDLVLREDAEGKRSMLNTLSGNSWRIDVECDVVRAVSFLHGIAVFVKMPGGSQRIIWAHIDEEALSFFGGEMDGCGGKEGVMVAHPLPQAFGANGPFLIFGAGHSLYTHTTARERDDGIWCGTVTDASIYPYVLVHNRRFEVCLRRPDEKKLETLYAFDLPPKLHRVGDHLVVTSTPFPKELMEVRWGDRLQHAVSKCTWRKIDFEHARVMEREGFSKLVAPARCEEDGPWQITDGLVKYGPTLRSIVRLLPSADGKSLRVWGWNGKTLVRFTATIYS